MKWPTRREYSSEGSVFLTRWWLFGTDEGEGPALMVHKFHRPDNDRCLHDHPWDFLSLVLWNGYEEEVEREHPAIKNGNWRGDYAVREKKRNRAGFLLWRPAEFRHRISALPGGPCWTLVLRLRKRRPWGFWTEEGWVHNQRFFALVGRGVQWCGGRVWRKNAE